MQKSNVKKNTLFNTVKTVFGIIYPLITFPYISRVLMAENVGKVNFGNSIVSYFSLIASLGVSTYAIRECSKVRDNQEELNRTASQIFSINIISTLISYFALVITLIVARPLENYRELICIQSTTILFTTLGADWINSVMEDFKYIAVRTIGMQLVSLALMFLFVRRPEDYIKYAVISVVASSGANAINIFYRKKFCKIALVFNKELLQHVKPIITIFSMTLCQTIYASSDITILGLIKGDQQVGLYSASVKIYTLVNTLIGGSLTPVLVPKMSDSFKNKNYIRINEHLKYAVSFVCILGIPALIGVNVIAKGAVFLLGGEQYFGAITSLRILTIAMCFSITGGIIGNLLLIPDGKEKWCLRANIVSAVLNVVLNVILIPYFGLNAAAFTTVIAELVGVILMSFHINSNIRISRITNILKAPIIESFIIVFTGMIVNIYVDSLILETVLIIFISAILYLLVLNKTKVDINFKYFTKK